MFLCGDEEGAGLIPSITWSDSFLLSFLFFHWLSSCFDRVESIEACMEAWRRGIRPSSNDDPPWDLEDDDEEEQKTEEDDGMKSSYIH